MVRDGARKMNTQRQVAYRHLTPLLIIEHAKSIVRDVETRKPFFERLGILYCGLMLGWGHHQKFAFIVALPSGACSARRCHSNLSGSRTMIPALYECWVCKSAQGLGKSDAGALGAGRN